MVIGANPTERPPRHGGQDQAARMKGVPLIVIDPRVIEMVKYAAYHLQLRPGTNVALLSMFAYYIWEPGLVDREFIEKRCRTGPNSKTGCVRSTGSKLGKDPRCGPQSREGCGARICQRGELPWPFTVWASRSTARAPRASCSSRTSP